ncbi:MAG: virulence factor SrfB, partial [Desulfovibrio sp.]|nr:virulence factor SrfB [Desulfovibrio sp.]
LRTFTCTFGDFFQKPGQPQDPKGARQARAGSLAAQSAQAVKEALQKESAKEQGKDQTRGEAAPDSGAAQPEEDGSTLLPGLRLSPRPQQGVANYFQNVLASLGAHATLDLMDIPVVFSLDAISEDIRRTLGDTLSSLCEMVHLYDADILLVTGRPSAWKGVIQTILAKTPLTPDRVVAMRSYHVGSWYPCADTFGCIADPKSTVVVGAILCALSSGYLEGINFDASHMHPSSTARFVGELNLQGQLEKDKIWFTVDNDGTVSPEEREITYHSPITIGYRQLAVDRWPASRYYKLDFVDKKTNASGPFAVRIKLNKDSGRMALAEDGEVPQTEGEINILEVNRIAQSGERMPLRPTAMTATLQTLPNLEGYWLDSGIIVSEG